MYDSSVVKQKVKNIASTLRLPPKGVCLIVGAPRSGTTALVNWLNEQSGIASFNESRKLVSAHYYINQINRFSDLDSDREILFSSLRKSVLGYYASKQIIWQKLLLEKEPMEPIAFPDEDYEGFLQNARKLFPEIKLLFIVREPLATIWSMQKRQWGHSLTDAEPRDFSLDESIEIWNRNARIMLDAQSDPSTYICRFESLVNNPARESASVMSFLDVAKRTDFQPKATKNVGFEGEKTAYILEKTRSEREALGYA